MGYLGYGIMSGIGTGVIQGQNGTGMGSEDIGDALLSLAGHTAVGAGAGVAANVASKVIGRSSKTSILGVAATIAGGAYFSSKI